jgi:hypothetical protein
MAYAQGDVDKYRNLRLGGIIGAAAAHDGRERR